MELEFQLLGKSYQAKRFKLRQWLTFADLQEKVMDSAERLDIDGVADAICSYLSVACDMPIEDIRSAPWYDAVYGYSCFLLVNKLDDRLPLLHALKDKFQEVNSWEYEGRIFYYFVHILASAYSWTMTYIEDMDIDDALAMIQESSVERQLQREWEWSLSEIAYSYDENTHKSKFIELPRPNWMKLPVKQTRQPNLPKIRIPIDMMPKGIVISYNPDEPIVN